MNLVNECPDVSDNWKGGIPDVARLLGLNRKTIIKYAELGKRGGGLDWHVSRSSGRKLFSGKEVKRFWREFA